MFIHMFNCNMVIESKVKKWGNSFGILITKEEIRKKNIHEDENVIVEIKKKLELDKLFGICKFKRPVRELTRGIKEGYEN